MEMDHWLHGQDDSNKGPDVLTLAPYLQPDKNKISHGDLEL